MGAFNLITPGMPAAAAFIYSWFFLAVPNASLGGEGAERDQSPPAKCQPTGLGNLYMRRFQRGRFHCRRQDQAQSHL